MKTKNLNQDKENELLKHIIEKFKQFAQSRGIKLLEEPCVKKCRIFKNGRTTWNLAASAQKDNQKGYLINLGTKFEFFGIHEARCGSVANGKEVPMNGSKVVVNNGHEFHSPK